MNVSNSQFDQNDFRRLANPELVNERKFVVYEETEEDCDEKSSISTLTFLNFVLASLTIAASVSGNTNSNANANNDNNNNNNLNDNNVNIGNNNNNVNSENMLTFQPMVGKRKRRYLNKGHDFMCTLHDNNSWASETALNALEFFARLESCKKFARKNEPIYRSNNKYNICLKHNIFQESNRIELIEIMKQKEFASHLFCGALSQFGSVGQDQNLRCNTNN